MLLLICSSNDNVKHMRGSYNTSCISEDVKVNSGLIKTVAFTFAILRNCVVDTLPQNKTQTDSLFYWRRYKCIFKYLKTIVTQIEN